MTTEDDFPDGIGAPARRALRSAGISRLEQLTASSEAESGQLHGALPKALGALRRALAERGMTFEGEKEP